MLVKKSVCLLQKKKSSDSAIYIEMYIHIYLLSLLQIFLMWHLSARCKYKDIWGERKSVRKTDTESLLP